jgi:hypothetical protein
MDCRRERLTEANSAEGKARYTRILPGSEANGTGTSLRLTDSASECWVLHPRSRAAEAVVTIAEGKRDGLDTSLAPTAVPYIADRRLCIQSAAESL